MSQPEYGFTRADLDKYLKDNPGYARLANAIWDKMEGEQMCVCDALPEVLRDLEAEEAQCPSDLDSDTAYADSDDWRYA